MVKLESAVVVALNLSNNFLINARILSLLEERMGYHASFHSVCVGGGGGGEGVSGALSTPISKRK